ncbi:MAG: tRNA 4-thiouridine(8) synthase ThiI [Bacilli bacterium]|nr:tRNA 4-thiouridine(8) synthase ThiI [Bacilli bacterium]
MDYNTIIVRFGEMSTKGKNRKDFINKLARVIKKSLTNYEEYYSMDVRHDHIYLNITDTSNFNYNSLKEVAGLHSFSLALKVTDIYELDELCDICLEQIKKEEGKTFKIAARRIDKSFPYISDEINRAIATKVLKNTDLKVDVHNPDILMSLEIRVDGIYIFTQTINGIGGYPSGSTGRCLMMLSGGIDSPVAAYLMMKRGIEVTCIHFASPPYTNSGVILKLEDLLSKLNLYQEKINLYIVPFTKIQEKIYEISFEGYPITIMRRMMYRLAEKLANKLHIPAIGNGESIGQVASQTVESLNVINEVTNMPILRPLCAMDKLDIIELSKKIDCYDISIRPFEDCCTIFAPVKPKTKPKLKECKIIESKFDFEPLLEEAIENVELKVIKL